MKMRLGIISIAVVVAVLAAGPAVDGGVTGRADHQGAVHPAILPFGMDVENLPAELFLVRTRGELPRIDGIEIHGVRDGVYLVSGKQESLAELARAQCAVIPIGDQPASARLAPRQWTTITSPDPTITAMVDQVSWDGVRGKIQWLQDFETRFSLADNHQEVAESIGAAFEQIGLTPVLTPFIYRGWTCWNVEATQTGVVYPDSFFIICGHFDATSGWPDILAPGADDNASGTAGVLTAAEILVNYDFKYSIKYICFGGEEMGLIGSNHWVEQAAQDSMGIVGALNFDMIGWWEPGVPRDLEIETNHASQWLAAAIVNAADLYVGAPYILHVYDGAWWGDHASFWTYGFFAVNHEESWDWDDPDFNPRYHTLYDELQYLSEEFTVENIKVGVAALATLARLDTTVSGVEDLVPPLPAASITAYPNPFSDRVTFTVTGVPDRDEVRVIIYDVRGRRVGGVPVLLRDGRGIADWNITDDDKTKLRSGVYFVKVEGLSDAAPTKIVYIK